MKKITILTLLLSMCLFSHAQYRDVKLPEKPKTKEYKNYEREDAGFWCAIEAEGGSSIMANKTNTQYAGATATAGYRISEYLRIGAGVGARYYFNNAYVRCTSNDFGVPIFANARGNFISAYDRDGVPFWSVNVGGITNEGFYFSPTLGYSFGGLRNNFLIGLNYSLVTFKDLLKQSTAYSYVAMKLGYEF